MTPIQSWLLVAVVWAAVLLAVLLYVRAASLAARAFCRAYHRFLIECTALDECSVCGELLLTIEHRGSRFP